MERRWPEPANYLASHLLNQATQRIKMRSGSSLASNKVSNPIVLVGDECWRTKASRPQKEMAGEKPTAKPRRKPACGLGSGGVPARRHPGSPADGYLPSFQMSVPSFQSFPAFSQTTTYFPITSCGVGPLVFRL